MKLLIQPENGIAPLVAAIKRAKKSVDIKAVAAESPRKGSRPGSECSKC
jgi:hypothetical protein